MPGAKVVLTAQLRDGKPVGSVVAEQRLTEMTALLRSADEEKSVVKFDRHHLLTDEVRKHITEGKLPTRLAMSWEGRIGFVLTESLAIKGIANRKNL